MTTITPVVVPARLDESAAEPFVAMITVTNEALRHDVGLDHLDADPAEVLPGWQDQTYHLRRGFLAHDAGGRAVGSLTFSAPKEEGATEMEFELGVLPDARGGDVESALFARLEEEARSLGRSALQTYTAHRIDESARAVPSPSGYGGVPLDATARTYLDAGFALAQVDRNSAFDLTGSLDAVRRMCEDAVAFAGPDYRLLTFSPPTPTELRESLAFVLSRMSTDVPLGALTVTEEVWDAARVAVRDERIARSGLLVSVAAILHVPTDRIVAYNDLAIGADRTRPTHQWGTLVAREHRGHRLGTIVKCANILRWHELVPTSPFISTFNAEENRPMLDVNEAIGFTPLTVGGAWEKRLD
ncbi:GNAT family N-acetyltransferase [Microbacterium flavum]|uniref:GNAT family N-acetyltransferase n=1 Tax=Microbacterium flavum TaxID=415216 RepID=A0ABS5XW73_9MICO|nr:GNAT family N-acetyltransferase [Microbacterium flavum]MBT8798795.1 GNAT family N-acetyltransferase [Microbacterium flavum]